MTHFALRERIRASRREAATHLFAVGQTVRLKAQIGMPLNMAEIYHVTARLPPRDNTLQYRIRNDDERHERVAAEDSLEAVRATPGDRNATLIERTFGNGQGTETKQSRDPQAEAGESGAKD